MSIEKFIEDKLHMLDRGIVATPNQDYLLQFTQANSGSNDYLLMQMAKNHGYKLALEHIQEKLQSDTKNNKMVAEWFNNFVDYVQEYDDHVYDLACKYSDKREAENLTE